tara:strand:+ start:489 stop:1094 length:606 start_codon:yes stop_codon:yes gene_type:complete
MSNVNTSRNLGVWFPEVIATYFNVNHADYETDIVKKCYDIKNNNKENGGKEWVSNVYNTWGVTDVSIDKTFKSITEFTQKCVEEYVDQLGMNLKGKIYNPKLAESWFNTYDKGDFQEYHLHESIISTIYFVSCDKNDSRTIFKSNRYEAYPITYETDYRPSGRVSYDAVPGKLLVFRSHLEHCVEQKTTDNPRITIASNFI